MIKMDFKGLMWVGNVFQKFEAMCLEVEEVVCEVLIYNHRYLKDTVNYVENQVQTVGESMKKFYSDIMQDVLPPSSIDPVKVAAADLSLNPYADFSIPKKPKVRTKNDDVANHNFEAKAETTIENCRKRGVIKRLPRKENNLILEDLDRVSECYEMDKKCDDVATSRSRTVMSTEKVVSKADMILPSELGAKKENQMSDTSSEVPLDESATRINGACGTDGVDSMMGSYVSCNQRISESAFEDSSPTGDADMDFFESHDDIAEPAETIYEFDEMNCVVVGREDLSVAAQIGDKSRSYKKKIRKAFSSKKSARKQEYKQLALQHGSLSTELNQEIADSSMPRHQIPESEWELL